ncbi:acyl-coenzyme A thioesterase 13-like [Photinus pyralis]|uniref:acyl-coenzyme A thioesterase 13-like n=1 Tax=Photinus pyralis TaxID=7054 RepID=UPI00126751A7|nr:acyl-coenzyme A thioesterase 13-like [Photinus pyralis]
MNPIWNGIRRFGTLEGNQYFRNLKSGYDKILQTMNVIELQNGDGLAELTISKDHVGRRNTAEGGFLTGLVDTFTSLAHLTHSNCCFQANVTADIHVSFVRDIPLGKVIQIEAKTVKCGQNLAFLECRITDKETGELCAKVRHTKYML